MSERLYKAFVLRTPSVWKMVVDIVKAHAQAFIDRDRPLLVIITSQENDATESQRNFWHGVLLPRIAEEIPADDGELKPVPYWHEKLVLEFLGMSETVSASGKIKRQRRSTARGKITAGEYAELITRIQVWAANRGVDWE